MFPPYGLVVQLVRTPACHAGGRGFESLPGRQFNILCWCGSTVEQLTCNQQVVGSIPIASSILFMEGFPSGQREQTVNLPSQTSKVRILPPPPSLSKVPELPNESSIKYSAHAGKDEKLRPRFDWSASERALPQATTRRAKRAALSNPSPTTITFKSP